MDVISINKFILLLILLSFCNCIQLVPQDDTLTQLDAPWGFTRNIINIDTFFKSDPDAKLKKMSPEER